MGEGESSVKIGVPRGQESSSANVIPGLPHHLALLILVRLPRALHGCLRCVSPAWRDAVQPSSVTALRNSLHISEIWVSLLFQGNRIAFYDPLLRRLSTSIPLSADAVHVLSAVGSQVFTISLLTREPREPIGYGTIQCFDAASMRSQSDPFPHLSTEQIFNAGFTCAAIDDQMYIAGGEMSTASKKVARLDVKTKTWEAMPDMHEGRVVAQAVVLQGCLYVIGGYGSDNDEVPSGEIWDPRSQEWMLEPQLWPTEVCGSDVLPKVAVALGILYSVQEVDVNYDREDIDFDREPDPDNDWELMQYVSASKSWISLGSFSIDEYACGRGPVENFQFAGAGEELWLIINCAQKVETCTAHVLSFIPSSGIRPPLWKSLAMRSSSEFLPGNVVVAGIVHV